MGREAGGMFTWAGTWVNLWLVHVDVWQKPTQSVKQLSFNKKINQFKIKKNVYIAINAMLLSRFSYVRLCATPETAAHQAPPSLGFSRQEHWSGLPFPSPGDIPDPGIKLGPPALQVDSLLLSHQGSPS